MASSSTRIMSSYSCEMRPRLLKEFLSDDSSLPSCSSFDNRRFKKSSSLKNPGSLLLRRRSKSASSISISAIHKASEAVIKAIRFFPFARGSPMKTPSLLPRSLSRKKSKRDQTQSEKNQVIVLGNRASFSSDDHQQVETPKIKDILRWKSFRDVVEDLSNKWLETDFTPEVLNSLDNVEDGYGMYYFMDHHQKKKKNKIDQDRFSFEEEEQHSPVSVLNDSVFQDDDREEGEPVSFFNRTVETMEKRKNILMQRLKEFENLAKFEQITQEEGRNAKEEENSLTNIEESNSEVEAKARQLLSQIKATTSSTQNDVVLLDFFRQELASNNNGEESEILKMAQAWMSKEYYEGTFDCELLDCKEACLKEMETVGAMKWARSNNFGEEQQELGRELEIQLLNELLDEVLADLLQ